MSAPPRVVLDTNVVLSSLLFPGDMARRLRRTWQEQRCTPLVSTATVQELLRVLAYPKFRLDVDDQHHLLADYLPWTRSVRIPDPPPALRAECRDPFDLPFLHLALVDKATTLVTGDGDLLALAGRMPFAIVPPAEFLQTPPA
ncbi:MAG: putative toxin-antitoxin system toxin component, PIN family [Luteimonas sp.]|nr:putative toxin-antitoxin system toxin component, PIN family [Luteimonas sp.]